MARRWPPSDTTVGVGQGLGVAGPALPPAEPQGVAARVSLVPKRIELLEGAKPALEKVEAFLAKALEATGGDAPTTASALVPWIGDALLSNHSVKAYGRDDRLPVNAPTSKQKSCQERSPPDGYTTSAPSSTLTARGPAHPFVSGRCMIRSTRRPTSTAPAPWQPATCTARPSTSCSPAPTRAAPPPGT